MIIGRELVKTFSAMEEDLYEKAFSDGYEYAQREFAEEEKEKKMRFGDKVDVWGLKYANSSAERKRLREQLDNDPDVRKAADKKQLKRNLIGSGVIAGLGAVGGAIKDKENRLRGALKGAAALGGVSAAMSGLTYAGNRAVDHEVEKDREIHGTKKYDRQRDLLDVADGKMSKGDFTKKWYRK